MLVLKRKKGDSIQIGGKNFISIVAVQGENVRIGIDAPKDVPIVRHDAKNKSEFKEPEPNAKPIVLHFGAHRVGVATHE